MLLLQTL